MRLVCPNCGAQYEVPDEVISSEGRDVQCSNCGITWYQPSAAAMAAGASARLAGTEPEVASDEVETDAEGDWPEDPEASEEVSAEDVEPADGDAWDDVSDPADDADDLFAEDEYEEDYEAAYENGPGAPAADPALAEKVGDPVPASTPAARGGDTVAPLGTDAAWEDEASEDREAPSNDEAAETWHEPSDEEAADVWDEPSDDAADVWDEPSDDDAAEAWDEPSDDGTADAPEDEPPAAVAAAPRVTPRRPLPSDVQSVLREEAAFEARARTRSADPLESQPDLGLGEPETEAQRRDRESRERLARLRGMTAMAAGTGAAAAADPAPRAAPAPGPAPTADESADPAQASRRDLLPDIEEINSTLRTKGPKARPAAGGEAVVDTQDQRRGFRLGFGLVVLIGALLILFYMHAEWVKETVPALEETTDAYVRTADEFRTWLDTQAGRLQAWMEGMSE